MGNNTETEDKIFLGFSQKYIDLGETITHEIVKMRSEILITHNIRIALVHICSNDLDSDGNIVDLLPGEVIIKMKGEVKVRFFIQETEPELIINEMITPLRKLILDNINELIDESVDLSGYYYQNSINVNGAVSLLKNLTLNRIYMAISDSGITKDYAQYIRFPDYPFEQFFSLPTIKNEFSQDVIHGLCVQMVADELIQTLAAGNKLKTIHLKNKEQDYINNGVENFISIANHIIKIKQDNKLDVRVLSYSQYIFFDRKTCPPDTKREEYLDNLRRAVLQLNEHDILLVVIAGNRIQSPEGKMLSIEDNTIFSEIDDLPNVVIVGGSDETTERWIDKENMEIGSATGKSLDIVSPADHIAYGFLCNYWTNPGVSSGTSLAAPQVAVAAALIASINPNLSAGQIGALLLKSTNVKGTDEYGELTKQGYRNDTYGYGLLDLGKVVFNATASLTDI